MGTQTLNEQDSGRIVGLSVGDMLTVRLNENPTTGYRWSVDTAEGLEALPSRFEPGSAVGAAGMREFQFRATRQGSFQVRLKNWRAWEGEASVTGRFAVTVEAKP